MKVSFACTLHDRLRGLLRCEPADAVCVLAPCHDVHTYGMQQPLDIAFVSRDGIVLESLRRVEPQSRERWEGAYAVIERFSQEGPWFERGDRLSLEKSKPGRS